MDFSVTRIKVDASSTEEKLAVILGGENSALRIEVSNWTSDLLVTAAIRVLNKSVIEFTLFDWEQQKLNLINELEPAQPLVEVVKRGRKKNA